jgi:hypothetical protein
VQATRHLPAAAIADVRGWQNQATFVGFDSAKAEDFQDDEIDPRTWEPGEVVVTYRLSLHELKQHVERGTLELARDRVRRARGRLRRTRQ